METGAMGREIESRQGICRVAVILKLKNARTAPAKQRNSEHFAPKSQERFFNIFFLSNDFILSDSLGKKALNATKAIQQKLNQIKKALACFASTRRERGRGERARLPG
jgi:hypothetical protein